VRDEHWNESLRDPLPLESAVGRRIACDVPLIARLIADEANVDTEPGDIA